MPKLTLESRPENEAIANHESSVLFKVLPNGKVGRFRPRIKRKRETFAERNSRLGHLATRTSLTKINSGARGRDGEMSIGGA